jgi:hypothetical protein
MINYQIMQTRFILLHFVGRDLPAFAEAASRRQAITPLNGAFGERTLQTMTNHLLRLY